ncbi:MAG: class I SAM-dependent methyltransferase [Coriobacteriales bacterium]|nr:class I SAM-dependent methyltransferase [Coriobacteriales bacterium]
MTSQTYTLEERDEGLTLVADGMELRASFESKLARLRPNQLNRELLVRAARIKRADGRPRAVDATAGLGDDALLLAAAGFDVRMYECDPVIAALLRDALARAATHPELGAIVAHMELFEEDSIVALPQLEEQGFAPDVVLLDPMFPSRTKSAAVKKKFQLLHLLERPCEDEAALMNAARAAHPRKIVVKRPAKGPHLAGQKPSYALSGKAIRYDCYAL